MLWNQRRVDCKGCKMTDPCLVPYRVASAYHNGTYNLESTNGKLLQKKVNGCNLKPYAQRQKCSNQLGTSEPDTPDETPADRQDPPEVNLMHCQTIYVTLCFTAMKVNWRRYHSQRLGLLKPFTIPPARTRPPSVLPLY